MVKFYKPAPSLLRLANGYHVHTSTLSTNLERPLILLPGDYHSNQPFAALGIFLC